MKLKRLVSAVLAIGMALTILPTAAFAAGNDIVPSEVGGLEITEEGYPKVPDETPGSIVVNGVTVTRTNITINATGPLDRCTGEGWWWTPYRNKPGSGTMTIASGYSYKGSKIRNEIVLYNQGTINGGKYRYVNNSGTINDCYVHQIINSAGGVINGGTYYEMIKSNSGTINRAVFKLKSNLTDAHELTAQGCIINEDLQDHVYTVGDPKVTIAFKDTRKKVSGWFINGEKVDETTLPGAVAGRDGDYATLTFTMPTDKDVEITASKIATPLKIENGLPVDSLGSYFGSPYDGWTYNSGVETKELNKAMTIEDWYTADLENNAVKWRITNNGILQNGIIRNSVTNNGTVKDVTATSYFTNNGTIESGVFSRYTNFGEQNPAVRWVTVNGGTVNGMTTAGVVGEQEVTITAPDGFKCWSVAGDTDFTLTEEQKHTNPLTLKLNGEDKGTIILTAQSEEGYYPLNLTDGKAYSVTADGAKDKEITAARAGDTVILEADATLIPDGMVFDRWEITGNTELTGGFDASAEKTQFIMPNTGVTIRAMYRMADVEEPDVLGTVAVVATAGVGAAVLGWTGYQLGTELYLKTALPAGTAIPTNRAELALLVWNHAGKPAPAAVLPADATDTQKAIAWAVENDLLKAAKNNGETYVDTDSVSRVEVIRVWNKAQEK